MADFATTKQAQEITGKSLSTILRFARQFKNDPSVVKSSLVGGHWQYEVNTNILQAKYGKVDRSHDNQEPSRVEASSSQHSSPTGNDELLRSIVETLQKQLEEKDKTIQALINNNHQLSGVIAQLQLPAPKKRETPEKGEILSGKEETEKKHASNLTNKGSQNKETGKSSSKGKKEKGIVARIFNHKLF